MPMNKWMEKGNMKNTISHTMQNQSTIKEASDSTFKNKDESGGYYGK